MSDVVPQFTYSPEGLFEVSILPHEQDGPDTIQSRSLGAMEASPGAEISTAGSGLVRVTVDVEAALGRSFNKQGEPDLVRFLAAFKGLTHCYPDDGVDRIVGLEVMTDMGAKVSVYVHLQRYLNAQGMDEETGRDIIMAMAQPSGHDYVRKSVRDFAYTRIHNGDSVASGYDDFVSARTDNFDLHDAEEKETEFLEKAGRVKWRKPDFTAHGDCSCLGVNSNNRRHSLLSSAPRLYELSPHNVDTARQSLALVLGLGALSYHAAMYEGQEDVFTHAEWGEPESYPKPDYWH